jgi:hypothetical protein
MRRILFLVAGVVIASVLAAISSAKPPRAADSRRSFVEDAFSGGSVARICGRTRPRKTLAPPPGCIATALERRKLALGSYCWSRRGRGVCVNAVPPSLRTDIPRLKARPSEIVSFELRMIPQKVVLSIQRDGHIEQVALAPSRVMRWEVPPTFQTPPNGALLWLFVRAPRSRSGGSVTYLAHLATPA